MLDFRLFRAANHAHVGVCENDSRKKAGYSFLMSAEEAYVHPAQVPVKDTNVTYPVCWSMLQDLFLVQVRGEVVEMHSFPTLQSVMR